MNSVQKRNRTRFRHLLIQESNNLDLMQKLNLFTLQKLDSSRANANISNYVKDDGVSDPLYEDVQKSASPQQRINSANQTIKSFQGNPPDNICQNVYNSESDQQKRRFATDYLRSSTSKNVIDHFYSILNIKERNLLNNAIKKVRNLSNSLNYTESNSLRKDIERILHSHNNNK